MLLFKTVLPILLVLLHLFDGNTATEQHIQRLSAETYKKFINNGNGVVYFFKREIPQLPNFFKNMEKSAIIMEMYDTRFALVDCNEMSVDYCEHIDSQEKVYVFRNGHMILDTTLDSMFDVNSIISNVLQVILINKAPIMQTVSELQVLEQTSRGVSDVVIGYQYALGTYEHRIFMEIVYVFHERFRFVVVNDKSAIQHLPGTGRILFCYDRDYKPDEMSAVWFMRCKGTMEHVSPCPVFKYRGKMMRTDLSNFFHMLQLPSMHSVSEDGDYDPFNDNGLDSVYLYHNMGSKAAVRGFAEELSNAYTALFGIVLVNIERCDASKHGYMPHWKLPALAVKKAGETEVRPMSVSDTPVRFISAQFQLYVAEIVSEALIAHGVTAAHCPGGVCMDYAEADLSAIHSLMEQEDDMISNSSYNMRNITTSQSHVIELNDKTLYNKIRDMPLLYVLYYIPIEGKNDVSLRVFAKAAESLTTLGLDMLTVLSCYDWTNVCSQMNVTAYPTIRVYKGSVENWRSYTGLLTPQHLVNSVVLQSADSPLILSTEQEVENFLEGSDRLKTDTVTGVSVLGLFSSHHKSHIRSFASAAERLQGEILFGLMIDENFANSRCSDRGSQSPCIIIHKRRDLTNPWLTVSMNQLYSVSDVTEYVQRHSKPSIPEMTAENFLEYLSKHEVFVIAFTGLMEGEGGVVKVLGEARGRVGAEKGVGEASFLFMNTSSPDGTALSILKHHVEQPRTEEIIIIHRAKGSVYHYKEDQTDVNKLSAWLSQSLIGTSTPTGVLEPIDPTPSYAGYDFLKLLELDSKLTSAREDVFNQDQHHVHGAAEDADLLMSQGHMRGEGFPTRDMMSLLGDSIQDDLGREALEEINTLAHSRLLRKPLKKMMKHNEGQEENSGDSGSTGGEMKYSEHGSKHVEL